jgi:CubicO group peptidase (beta-lactamase class C family)
MLKSTANDLLTFLAASMGPEQTSTKADMVAMLSLRRPMGSSAAAQSLGWQVDQTPTGEIVSQVGASAAGNSYIAIDLKTRVGVVVLVNGATKLGVFDIARYALTGKPPFLLTPLPPEPRDVQIGTHTAEPRFAADTTAPNHSFRPG